MLLCPQDKIEEKVVLYLHSSQTTKICDTCCIPLYDDLIPCLFRMKMLLSNKTCAGMVMKQLSEYVLKRRSYVVTKCLHEITRSTRARTRTHTLS